MAHHTTTTREQLDADEAFARRLQRGSLFAENEVCFEVLVLGRLLVMGNKAQNNKLSFSSF